MEQKLSNPLSARITKDEYDLIISNWDALTGSAEKLSGKDFIMKVVRKCLAGGTGSAPVEVSKQSDLDRINELQLQVEEMTEKNKTVILPEALEQTELKLSELQTLNQSLQTEIEALKQQLENKDTEISTTIENSQIKEDELLIKNVNQPLKYVLQQMCKLTEKDENEILLNRIFNTWLRCPGDCGLEKYRPKNMTEIDNYFKSKKD